MQAIHSPFSAGIRLIGLIAWLCCILPVFLVCRWMGKIRWAHGVTKVIYQGLIKICGFKIELIGVPCDRHPVLYVSNHTSYFDILVLGSVLNGSFVAKKEVSTWPVIGPLAQLAGTVFVERRARHTKNQRDEMKSRLDGDRNSLILFPEGTSNDGTKVLPFKSALFSVVEGDGNLPVQPISLAYTKLDGLPMGRGWRPYYAWYGDMELASHIWQALGLGRATVTVIFHPPVHYGQWGSRKALADHCYGIVRNGVNLANGGKIGELNLTLAEAIP